MKSCLLPGWHWVRGALGSSSTLCHSTFSQGLSVFCRICPLHLQFWVPIIVGRHSCIAGEYSRLLIPEQCWMVLISNAPLGAAQLECLPRPRFSALLGAPPGLALGEIRLPVKQRQALQVILMQGTFSSCSDPTAIFTKTPEKSQKRK